MLFTPTPLEDAYFIDLERHADERGFLARTVMRARVRPAPPADAHRA
jgi:dTDP-4-dehydrorhamnose 3,5-epimerase-like enzyme